MKRMFKRALEKAQKVKVVGATLVGGALIGGTNAMAAGSLTTAPDFTGASSDVVLVVVAVIGFLVTIFGLKAVIGLIRGK